MLKVDNNFTPCPVDDGDEIFPNGIFEINITKIISHVQKNPDSFLLENEMNCHIGTFMVAPMTTKRQYGPDPLERRPKR